MATLSNEQIEQLNQQLKKKQEEIKVIYDQLIEAGEVEVPDDYLDGVAGGFGPWGPNLPTGGASAFPPNPTVIDR